MTTKPYSEDLRKKVIKYLQKGKTQREASEIFGVHRNTINRWSLRYSREGNCAARQRLGYKSRLDYNKIELFVRNNADSRLADIGTEFGISKGHAGVILKKLGFSYKKKPLHMWKQVRKRERLI